MKKLEKSKTFQEKSSKFMKSIEKARKNHEKKEKNHIEYRFDHKNWNVYLIYPSTYVNNSGLALKYLLNNNKFSLDKVIIISDDINLEEGRLRIRRKGSSGGHNGLNSIINHIGSENFIRLKIGIGKPRSNGDQIKYVLSKVKNKKIMYNKNWSRGEMDITRVFGTWIWGSNPYETAKWFLKNYY